MSEETKIEWATSTGNPWIGCTKVSPGCKNCYAAALDHRRFSRTMGGGTPGKPVSHWGKGAPRFRTKGFWKDAIKWNREAGMPIAVNHACCDDAGEPAKAYAPRPRVFPSLCDWLDEEVPVLWLNDFLRLIHDTPNLDWLLLTKRPENWRPRLEAVVNHWYGKEEAKYARDWLNGTFVPSNVWLGTSVENQKYANKRIPELLKIPARVRFLSVEPLLGPVDFPTAAPCGYYCDHDEYGGGHRPGHGLSDIHWVIVGGESGSDARACNIEWIRDVVRQCREARIPCFVKQLGRYPQMGREDAQIIRHPKGGDMEEWSTDLRVREFPQV